VRSRVLYISYTGLLQPLGQSQVLQYLLALAKDHDISLITYERPADLKDRARVAALQQRCDDAGLSWTRLRYHKSPSVPASLYDIAVGTIASLWIAARRRIQVVHARSYIPGVIGLMHKRLTGRKFVFDMRGFWPDERVDGGIWPAGSPQYLATKALEKQLLLGADLIVSLTHAGVEEMKRFDYLSTHPTRYEVIPTCTNMEIFRPTTLGKGRTEITLGYVGAASVWQLFPQIATITKRFLDAIPNSRFLVVNRYDHAYVLEALRTAGVDLDRVELVSSDFYAVADHIGRMDAAIFFRKPVFSSAACCPTKLGELLACGRPVLTNRGIGDVDTYLSRGRVGVSISEFSEAEYARGLTELLALMKDPEVTARCLQLARDEFSLESGVRRYDAIYRSLEQSA